MIPKIIHYIWLGGKPTPKIFDKCLESWQKYCPDYEIKRWDESNLNIDLCPYTREAYDAGKYAFASDVFRLDILNTYGGIYLDIDVELLKPIDEFLDNYAFTGFETSKYIAPGLIMGTEANNQDLFDILTEYKGRHFNKNGVLDTKTICETFTEYYENKGLEKKDKTQKIGNIVVYASEYFSPCDYIDHKKVHYTNKTHSVHWYNGSWIDKPKGLRLLCQKIKSIILSFLKLIIGEKQYNKLKSKVHKRKN